MFGQPMGGILPQENASHHSLIAYINQWEQTSIEKIQHIARDARREIDRVEEFRRAQTVMCDVDNLTERLKRAQQDEVFSKDHLREWISLLERLKQQRSTSSPEIRVSKNSIPSASSAFHARPSVKSRANCVPDNANVSICTDRFEYCHGNAHIEESGCLITNGSNSFFGTEIRGRLEYSSGRHRHLFRIENNPSKVWIFMGIVSKMTGMGANLFTASSVYGWGDYNDYFLAGERQKDDREVFFTHTQEKDIIELALDCSKRTITYENKRRQKRQKLNIDTTKCPFPWQLYISLGGRGDQIRLLDTSTDFDY